MSFCTTFSNSQVTKIKQLLNKSKNEWQDYNILTVIYFKALNFIAKFGTALIKKWKIYADIGVDRDLSFIYANPMEKFSSTCSHFFKQNHINEKYL